jgi:glycosyltransferase involved in cell wall biosynthesis
MPFFTVILPSFNRARLIEKAIRSVQDQSINDWELVIVDDGSIDDTFSRVAPIIREDRRMRYHYAGNRGLASARNLGIQLASGDYITFLDSDDTYKSDHLSLRAEILKHRPEIELLHGGVEIVGPDTVRDKYDPTREIPLSECVIGGTFVIGRSLVDRLQGFRDVPYGDDRDFFDRAESVGATIVKVDFPTYVYNRLEPDSMCAIVEREGVEGILRFRNADKNHD